MPVLCLRASLPARLPLALHLGLPPVRALPRPGACAAIVRGGGGGEESEEAKEAAAAAGAAEAAECAE